MAHEDSTGRSGGERWPAMPDARNRLRLVRSEAGDRGRENAARSPQIAAGDDPGLAARNSARAQPAPSPASVLSTCPDCDAALAVLRIIPGRGGAEYWTKRCTRCGGIHLDIVRANSPN